MLKHSVAIGHHHTIVAACQDIRAFWSAVGLDANGEPRHAATTVASLLDGTLRDAALAADSLALLNVPEIAEAFQRDVKAPLEALLVDKAAQTLAARFGATDICLAYTTARIDALAALTTRLTAAMLERYKTLEIDDDEEDDEEDFTTDDEYDDDDDDDNDNDDADESSEAEDDGIDDNHETLDDDTFEAIRARLEANKRRRLGGE